MQMQHIVGQDSGQVIMARLALLAPLALLLIIGGVLIFYGLARSRSRIVADLRANEAMLDRAGRLAGVGGWELDLLTQRMRWSRQTCQMHEVPSDYRPSLEQALAFYVPEGREALALAVQRAAGEGLPWDLELSLTTALGRVIWVRVVGEVLPTAKPCAPGGSHQHLIGSMQDVTARRALEEAMRRNHAVLRSVVDNLPCGLAVYDGQSRLIAHNAAFGELLELPASFFEGRQPRYDDYIAFNLLRGEYGSGPEAECLAECSRSFVGAPRQIEFERERPNGTAIEARAAPMPGGGIIITYADITPRRRTEAELRRSDQLLRGAMDAIDEGFVLFDPQDRFVFCNECYRSTYADVAALLKPGTSYEEILRARIAANPAHQARTAPERLDAWVAERVALHQRGDAKTVHRLNDGRWLRIIERKMADGHIVGFRVDISDLMRATEAAEKASVAKSQFLANMSHEIRTPMNAVLGMLKLLQRTSLTARQRDYAHRSEGAARSLLGLLNDILDFSKVEVGKMALDPQPLRLDALLRDLGVILAATLERKEVALHFDIDPTLPRGVVADSLRLQQVLINLGGNAIKFTKAGEVRVSLQVVQRTAEAVNVEFSVSDTGIGIAPEHQARIFDGFTQAEASTSRRFGGSGLGLAISQRLVALMGGELALQSTPGRGSRFSFCLTLGLPGDAAEQGLFDGFLMDPVTALLGVDNTASCTPLAVPITQQRLQGLRLLVVEDNVNNQQVTCELLADEGAEVLLACDGQQALSLLAMAKRDGLMDAVLMDVQMPVMDGYTATRLIRRQLQLTLPVIAMTANALSTDRQLCLDAGMDEHVGKPFDIDHLVAVLLRHCSQVPAVLAAAVAETRREAARPLPPALLAQAEAAGIALGEALARMSSKSQLFVRMVGALADEAAALPSPLVGRAAARALHGLRGLAATLGADRLAELAAQGEYALQADGQLPEDWLASFDAARQQGLAALAALADQLPVDAPTTPAAVVVPCVLVPRLTALIELLLASDMAALDSYAELRPTLLAEQPVQAVALDSALARLDFAEAANRCQAVLRLRAT